ncbi:hypothetical protein CLOBOL_01530 [Enterocloster bolteae ATCC BAA-613]|uniref:Uncharacterized protein n=1 Tax=Enterocloster bolteae (strain ATCC BAA-613 / DSM 15670 / CCUG 46953 / JCM 12243 / WAL 16351) TaxID=411902 RepID=A8RL83_ENTBW|nr:hypothetical protein CLOBOL_01530 [Enterocloster bolteae ATCC BAA-613]
MKFLPAFPEYSIPMAAFCPPTVLYTQTLKNQCRQ